jgi:cytochrome c553
MDHNFNNAFFLVDAVVAGDLTVTKAYADALVKLPLVHQEVEVWRTGLGQIVTHAGAVSAAARAENIDDAAAATARTLASCAACHRVLAGPKAVPPDDAPEPSDDDKPARRAKILLERHQWAADRMKDGLYVPDDESWRVGAQTFAASVLVPDRDRREVPAAVAIEREVKALPLATLEGDARAKAWGELIPRCVACHRALGTKIAPPDLP